MPTDKTTPATRRRLRHVALDGGPLRAPPGEQDHWTYLGEPEPAGAVAPRGAVKLATPPTPAVMRYSRSGEVEPLLIGHVHTVLGRGLHWLRWAVR